MLSLVKTSEEMFCKVAHLGCVDILGGMLTVAAEILGRHI